MKKNNRQDMPFTQEAFDPIDFPPDLCRHSICHGERLSFTASERAGTFDEKSKEEVEQL